MGPEGNATCSSSSSSPATAAAVSSSAKRGRDIEDDVYVDNLHSHKRYLSELMASSLNGLTVGDPMSGNIMDSPGRSESNPYLRDDISVQYSSMSEDSDDSRYYDSSTNTCSSHPESAPTSPVSPYRYQKPPTPSHPPYSSILPCAATSQPRQRSSDTEGRFPSSPSDICHSADLRRAALLRSVQMRTQPLGSSQFDTPLSPGQESVSNMEAEERPCSCMKVGVGDRSCQIGECMPLSVSECENEDKSSETITTTNLKGDGSGGNCCFCITMHARLLWTLVVCPQRAFQYLDLDNSQVLNNMDCSKMQPCRIPNRLLLLSLLESG